MWLTSSPRTPQYYFDFQRDLEDCPYGFVVLFWKGNRVVYVDPGDDDFRSDRDAMVDLENGWTEYFPGLHDVTFIGVAPRFEIAPELYLEDRN